MSGPSAPVRPGKLRERLKDGLWAVLAVGLAAQWAIIHAWRIPLSSPWDATTMPSNRREGVRNPPAILSGYLGLPKSSEEQSQSTETLADSDK